ncbi:hypothetical protein Scep_019736 [Stephania cephalantha]|uniref:Uncharacterized protein n=1 Tax=Stephania cephalantha TaxID=152367 RepID=A0AAP0IBV1_9MAGN
MSEHSRKIYQRLNGTPPKFLYGELKELVRLERQARAKPMNLSYNIVQRRQLSLIRINHINVRVTLKFTYNQTNLRLVAKPHTTFLGFHKHKGVMIPTRSANVTRGVESDTRGMYNNVHARGWSLVCMVKPSGGPNQFCCNQQLDGGGEGISLNRSGSGLVPNLPHETRRGGFIRKSCYGHDLRSMLVCTKEMVATMLDNELTTLIKDGDND